MMMITMMIMLETVTILQAMIMVILVNIIKSMKIILMRRMFLVITAIFMPGIRRAWDSPAINDLQDSYGQEWTYR